MKLVSSLDELRREFADAVVDSDEWFATALDLMFTAECLESKIEKYFEVMKVRGEAREKRRSLVFLYEPDPRGSYLMLVAYAVENLCKGLLVVKEKELVWSAAEGGAKGNALSKTLKGHKILDLLSAIDFPFRPGDKELAALLRRNSEWSGRYPVPIRFDHETLSTSMPDVEALHNGGLTVVKDFISRVDSFISSELEDERERRIALALRRDELPADRGPGVQGTGPLL
jgi:hypothetical protein